MVELLKGKDDSIRAVKVEVITNGGKKVLTRSLQHLVPLEIRSKVDQQVEAPLQTQPRTQAPPKDSLTQQTSRVKRNAAIVGDLRMKYVK